MTARVVLRVRIALVSLALPLLLGCGSADQTRAVPPPDDSLLNVTENVNLCPHFEGSLILPQTIPPGVLAIVVVRAVDPDGNDAALTYDWSLTAGAFSETLGPSTKYSCTDLGPQVLTVVTKDAHDCHVSLDIGVSCLDK